MPRENGAERWGERTTWVPMIELEPLHQAIPEGRSPLWSFLLCGSIDSLANQSFLSLSTERILTDTVHIHTLVLGEKDTAFIGFS